MSAVHLEIAGAVATLRLDNPARLNAFTPAMLEQLAAHCETLDRDGAVRAVLLTAEGERAFCAGADIGAWAGFRRPSSRASGCGAGIASSTGWRGCPCRRWP